MDTKQIILYNPNIFTKFFNYVMMIIVGILVVFSIIGLFHIITINDTSSKFKLFFSYLLICVVILLSIGFYIASKRLFHLKYIISIDEINTITYKTSKSIIKQFTFSDIDSISEEGQDFSLHLKDKGIFYLPFEFKNDTFFLKKLFDNYKTNISEEELFKPIKRKSNRFVTIALLSLFSPLIILPLLMGNILVIFLYIIGVIFLLLVINGANLIKINPEAIEIKNNFQTIMISKTEVKKIEFKRDIVFAQKGGIKYMYCCELVTNSDKVYRVKNSHISSIDLYCYLTFWTNSTQERNLIK